MRMQDRSLLAIPGTPFPDHAHNNRDIYRLSVHCSRDSGTRLTILLAADEVYALFDRADHERRRGCRELADCEGFSAQRF